MCAEFSCVSFIHTHFIPLPSAATVAECSKYIHSIPNFSSIHNASASRRNVVGAHLYYSRQGWRGHGLAS